MMRSDACEECADWSVMSPRVARNGFLMVGAGLFLQLILVLIPFLTAREGAAASQIGLAVFGGAVLLLSQFPGAILLCAAEKPPQLLRPAARLAVLTVFHVILLAIAVVTMVVTKSAANPGWFVNILFLLEPMFTWFEMWLIAVAAAKLAHFYQHDRLIASAEGLGRMVLSGAIVSAALIGWVAPRAGFVQSEEPVTAGLALLMILLVTAGLAWSGYVVAAAATLARRQMQKAEAEDQHQTPSP